ncbi:hypothetical protein NEHOM01_0046 [Nematocida homosporus]|uniref:uncharacterized protein n=1 Tax=Nematocida homosporus TaxID=1912981 RepID=UPI00221FABCB|nr:uncharacterized protein NEHOM01_0046 [Nematocida homosporus]KAI5184301.1 hypothetical protein NEHOM01_0046 [Nematocida homosporus]
MEKETKETYLDTIKTSIMQLMSSPADRDCTSTFMAGYNAIYSYCTEDVEDKYSIEGGEIYHLYNRVLLKYLEGFPCDYTLEKLVSFLAGYRRANERIGKMLAFLSRYFIRVNLEVSNNNVQDLKKVYFSQVFAVIIQPQETKLHNLFLDKIQQYIRLREVKQPTEEERTHRNKLLKTLRIFLREYIKIAESSSQKKSLKKLCTKMAKIVTSAKDESHLAIYANISAINALFAQKERTKKIFYSMLEEKIEEPRLRGFISTFVAGMLSKSINKQTYTWLSSFYSFVDYSEKSREIFMNVLLAALLELLPKHQDCLSLVRMLVFVNKHLRQMPRTLKLVRKPMELVFSRKLREVFARESTDEFENNLLELIETYAKKTKQPIQELSLFIANVPADRKSFWSQFLAGIKSRLILLNTSSVEKSLVQMTMRRIEKFKEIKLHHSLPISKENADYIDMPTLCHNFQFFELSNFEEIQLCLRDITISEMYFRREGPGLTTDCRLLAYTRWSCPKLEINIPCEIEKAWEEIIQYCREKGRKFLLGLCPTVSCAVVEIGNTEVVCDLVQAAVLILLGKTGDLTSEAICKAILVEPKEENNAVVLDRIDVLKKAHLLEDKDSVLSLTAVNLPAQIDLFHYTGQTTKLTQCSRAHSHSKGAIEAFIVRIAKRNTGIEMAVVEEKAKGVFSISDQEFALYIESLQEKGLISRSGSLLYFVP